MVSRGVIHQWGDYSFLIILNESDLNYSDTIIKFISVFMLL